MQPIDPHEILERIVQFQELKPSRDRRLVLGQLAKNMYMIDSLFQKLRDKERLPFLDPTITSESITRSLDMVPSSRSSSKGPSIDWGDFLRSIDYQYYLIGYLLRRDDELREGQLEFADLIDCFLKECKEHLTVADIVRTKIGVTRCRTNLRFAFRDLREAGLVVSEDERGKRAWTLSFIGLHLAHSFQVKPIPSRGDPFKSAPQRLKISDYYLRLDPDIKKRLQSLRASLPKRLKSEGRLSGDSLARIRSYVKTLLELESKEMKGTVLKAFESKFKEVLVKYTSDEQIQIQTRVLAEDLRKNLGSSN